MTRDLARIQGNRRTEQADKTYDAARLDTRSCRHGRFNFVYFPLHPRSCNDARRSDARVVKKYLPSASRSGLPLVLLFSRPALIAVRVYQRRIPQTPGKLCPTQVPVLF